MIRQNDPSTDSIVPAVRLAALSLGVEHLVILSCYWNTPVRSLLCVDVAYRGSCFLLYRIIRICSILVNEKP